jgi:phosphonate transport system substrate-binding protein
MPEEKRPLKVFLCHASVDKPKVRDLYRYLRKRGIRPWFDEVDLIGGQDWQVEIPKALATSDAIIICLTKNSVDKEGYVQREIKFALDKALEMPEGRIYLIPVRFEDCEVPYLLSRYHWVDLFVESGFSKLMKSLKTRAAQLERFTVQVPNPDESKPDLTTHLKQEQPPIGDVDGDGDISGNVIIMNAQEILDQEEVERESIEKAAREKEDRETVEKAAQEEAERELAEKAAREKAERETAEKKQREKELAQHRSIKPNNTAIAVAIIGLVGTLCAALIGTLPWKDWLVPSPVPTVIFTLTAPVPSEAPATEVPATAVSTEVSSTTTPSTSIPPPPPICDKLFDVPAAPAAGALGAADNPIVITFVPSGDTGKITKSGTAMADCLGKMTGLAFKMEVGNSFTASVHALGANKAQVSFLNTFSVLLAEQEYDIIPALVAVREYNTNDVDPDKALKGEIEPFYKGQFIANTTSGIKSFADLKGKTFCFVAPNSTSGYIIPRIILKANGIDPDVDFKATQNAGSHNNVAIAVYKGDCDAGVTFINVMTDAAANLKATYPDITDKVTVFAVTDRIPYDGMQFTKALNPKFQTIIAEGMLAMAADPGGKAVLKSFYNYDSFQVVKPDFYNDFGAVLKKAGVDPASLVK